MTATYGGGLGSGLTGTLPPGMDSARRVELERIAKSDVCAVCDGALDVAVDPTVPERVLRCNRCSVNRPDTRPRRELGPVERWENGEALDAIALMQVQNLMNRMLRRAEAGKPLSARWARRIERMEQQMPGSVTVYQPAAVMTPEDAGRFIDMAKLDNMTPELRRMALVIMEKTGLNPVLGEVMIYEKKVYVTVDGFRKLLNASGQFDGMEPPYYLSAAEKEAQGYAADDIVVRLALYRKGRRMPVYSIGKANPNRPFRGNVVEKQHPQIFAENRALRRGARAYFQDLLSGYGIDFAPDDEEADSAPATVHVVDPETGEILSGDAAVAESHIDGEYREVVPETGDAAELTAEEMDRRLADFLAPAGRSMADAEGWFQTTFGASWTEFSPEMKETALADLRAATATAMQERMRRAKAAQGAI